MAYAEELKHDFNIPKISEIFIKFLKIIENILNIYKISARNSRINPEIKKKKS
jgi:hypothetical protein